MRPARLTAAMTAIALILSPVAPAIAAPVKADAALAIAEAQLAEQKDKLLRLAAEFDNFRKRSVRERQEAESRGMSNLIRGILDALELHL